MSLYINLKSLVFIAFCSFFIPKSYYKHHLKDIINFLRSNNQQQFSQKLQKLQLKQTYP